MISLATKNLEKTVLYFPFLINHFRAYYRGIVKNEICLGKICSRDNVLCIGGGPLPCTALEIAEKTGAIVEVIDNDPNAIELASQIIRRLNLEDRVKVTYGDGQTFDVSCFSVVHVALQARPQDKILWNVMKKASEGTRILMRRPKDNLESFYSKLPKDCLLINNNMIKQYNYTIKETLLFIKGHGRRKNEKTTTLYNRNNINNRSIMVS